MSTEYRIIEMDTLPRVHGAYAYDVDEALKNKGKFLQSQYTCGRKMNVNIGDYVFILINNPKYEIKYVCKIVKCDIVKGSGVCDKYEINSVESSAELRTYMELELVNECPDGTLHKKDLIELGLNDKQNHGNKVTGELLDYLVEHFNLDQFTKLYSIKEESVYLEDVKIYYLETNVLYSLVNNLDLIVDNVEAYTSLYALEEIVSGICEMNFNKRKNIISKLFASKLKILPHMPKELLLAAFGIDISKLDSIVLEKKILWERAKLITQCDCYEKYSVEILHLEEKNIIEEKSKQDIDDAKCTETLKRVIKESTKQLMERKKRENKICKEAGVKSLREISPDQNIPGVEYMKIDVNRLFTCDYDEDTKLAKELLRGALENMHFAYEESDLDELVQQRNKNMLVAFLLGRNFYGFDWSYNGKIPKRNDVIDIIHLIYLQNENYVIVSDDNIFDSIAMSEMRIKGKDLINMCSH